MMAPATDLCKSTRVLANAASYRHAFHVLPAGKSLIRLPRVRHLPWIRRSGDVGCFPAYVSAMRRALPRRPGARPALKASKGDSCYAGPLEAGSRFGDYERVIGEL